VARGREQIGGVAVSSGACGPTAFKNTFPHHPGGTPTPTVSQSRPVSHAGLGWRGRFSGTPWGAVGSRGRKLSLKSLQGEWAKSGALSFLYCVRGAGDPWDLPRLGGHSWRAVGIVQLPAARDSSTSYGLGLLLLPRSPALARRGDVRVSRGGRWRAGGGTKNLRRHFSSTSSVLRPGSAEGAGLGAATVHGSLSGSHFVPECGGATGRPATTVRQDSARPRCEV